MIAPSLVHLLWHGLLTKREIKLAGYIGHSSSSFCGFMDRDEVEVHKQAKKERNQYPAILAEQAWSIKDLFYDNNKGGNNNNNKFTGKFREYEYGLF